MGWKVSYYLWLNLVNHNIKSWCIVITYLLDVVWEISSSDIIQFDYNILYKIYLENSF